MLNLLSVVSGETTENLVETPVVAEKKLDVPVLVIAGVSVAALAAAAYVFGKKEHE